MRECGRGTKTGDTLKIAILNDTHFGYKNGSSHYMNYQSLFYRNVFFPYCKEHGITEILHLGDMFDNRRQISIKTLRFVREQFLEKLAENNMHMHVIPGNHDTFFRNTNDLCSLVEVLKHYSDCVTLHMEPTIIDYDGVDVGLVPWINNTNYSDSLHFIANSTCPILAGHFEVAGFKYIANSNIKSQGENLSVFSQYDLVLSGHYHTRGTHQNVMYLGSQYEFNWSDVDDGKFFHVLDTVSRDVHAVQNTNYLYYRFYYNDTDAESIEDILANADISNITDTFVRVVVQKKNNYHIFDQFINQIQQKNPFDLSVIENFDVGSSIEAEENIEAIEDTSTLIDDYVDNTLSTPLDKDKLKTMLQHLYAEASMLETVI